MAAVAPESSLLVVKGAFFGTRTGKLERNTQDKSLIVDQTFVQQVPIWAG